MNTETKQPAAGEYWERNHFGDRIRIIANDDGDVIYRKHDGDMQIWRKNSYPFLDQFRHLPGCDSFDWKETVYPRYAVPTKEDDTLFDNCSYFIEESAEDTWKGVLVSGDPARNSFASMHLKYGRWKLVSREEAEARHERLHREWVISQLVIINRGKWPDHVPRPGVDWITANDVTGCIPIRTGHQQPKNSDLGCCFKIYCLPKDLPPEPVKAVTSSGPGVPVPGVIKPFRLLELRVTVGSARFCIYQIPINVEGQITADLILNNADPAKVVSRTVHLVNEEEF